MTAMLKYRRHALAVIISAVSLGPIAAAGAARPQPRWLPVAKSRLIVPGIGLGGLALGKALTPLPRGWTHPERCVTVGSVHGCVWSPQRATPGHPLTGPSILVEAASGGIALFSIAVNGPHPARSALSAWHTPQGLRIGSATSTLRADYPSAFRTPNHAVYALWGHARRSVTLFKVARGAVRNIEIDSCTTSSCHVTHG
jgi:hypothetical protein